jgi:hypothetical protein
MIAGLVLISAAVGMVAVVGGAMLSLPTWVIVLSYPMICSLTLLFAAALWNIRLGQPARIQQSLRAHS